MGRHLVTAVVLLLITVAAAQQKPATAPGLKSAAPPQAYEPPSPSATADELEQRADALRTRKAYADAIDYYRTALRRTRDKPLISRLHNKSGIAQLQLQRYKEAQKDFGRAIKADHAFAEAYNNLGAAYYMQKKYQKAVQQYQRALALREDDASFHSNLGTAYFMLKELPLAMQEYRRAFALDAEVFERNSQMGISAHLSNPENRAAYEYLLARMYAQAGNFDRSILYLRKAMEEGYKDIGNVYKDSEFAALRNDPRFAELMAQKVVAIPE
jgi:tetratricopeptide (TPR) repeat protein